MGKEQRMQRMKRGCGESYQVRYKTVRKKVKAEKASRERDASYVCT